ncbi:CTD kinase subunit beta [Hyphodiscus hymeniophilus]|uniref:RNA polymerase II holoenzyme cyclin-like subunit n=1 Tax=Hyphodiscus hymeniophilus TaxID=353542 RepID=A0A9P6VKK1_9HELO|nr:CTD kinase subunit beta [Hyphodiscus hymeniophilus]
MAPHEGFLQVAQSFIFQQQIQSSLVALGTNPSREDSYRLSGVQWINDVRTALQLPVRTFSTAVNYFHKFRLVHKDTEYQYQDAAAAALLAGCKIEDTLKKSREILCAAHNLKVPPAEHISSDDASFELPAKAVIGLERLMLEASGFDFRVRYPHKHLIKLGKEAGIRKDVAKVTYDMMIDLYKTFAPLKQTCATMSFACIELATLILEKQEENIRGQQLSQYKKWRTSRAQVMETMLDLLDLYTHFQKSSAVGPSFNIEKFIQLRIKLNQEIEEDPTIFRYTEEHEAPKTNGFRSNIKTPKTPITPASPSDTRINGRDIASPATLSPRSSGSGRKNMAHRGQDGTIRFMLDAEQAKQEKETVAEYFKVEYEEYEVEVEEPIKPDPPQHHPNPRNHHSHNHRNGQDNRFHHQNKRMRRH